MCPSQKCRLQDLNIEGGYSPKFHDWIVDAINDAQQEGQYIMIKEIDLSQSPHIWDSLFNGMWAYGIHLRMEYKDT